MSKREKDILEEVFSSVLSERQIKEVARSKEVARLYIKSIVCQEKDKKLVPLKYNQKNFIKAIEILELYKAAKNATLSVYQIPNTYSVCLTLHCDFIQHLTENILERRLSIEILFSMFKIVRLYPCNNKLRLEIIVDLYEEAAE